MDFEKEVIEQSKKGLVVVDFYANWCGPCKVLKPILEALSKELKFKLVPIDTELNSDIAGEFGVMSIPTVIFFKDGEPIEMFVGAYPEHAIRDLLKKHM